MSSYAEVETALAQMHDAGPDAQRGAFRGRIKHLQRLGVPLGDRPGKGKRIDYDEQQIWQLAIALELSEFGLDPTTIAEIITVYWDMLFKPWLESQAGEERANGSLLVISTALMSATWRPLGESMKGICSIGWVPRNGLADNLTNKDRRRVIVIDTWKMLRDLQKQIHPLQEL